MTQVFSQDCSNIPLYQKNPLEMQLQGRWWRTGLYKTLQCMRIWGERQKGWSELHIWRKFSSSPSVMGIFVIIGDQLFPDWVNGRLTKWEFLIEDQVQGCGWNVPEILSFYMDDYRDYIQKYKNTVNGNFALKCKNNQSVNWLIDWLIDAQSRKCKKGLSRHLRQASRDATSKSLQPSSTAASFPESSS